ncbi:hypothetical protein [Streptomyces sp. NPDC051776]|uniref:hypothetical protein n=1 Tax=Streptomyces sp. NPDC051776 TaxID=3155414 RepID=UPI003437B5B9
MAVFTEVFGAAFIRVFNEVFIGVFLAGAGRRTGWSAPVNADQFRRLPGFARIIARTGVRWIFRRQPLKGANGAGAGRVRSRKDGSVT